MRTLCIVDDSPCSTLLWITNACTILFDITKVIVPATRVWSTSYIMEMTWKTGQVRVGLATLNVPYK